MLHRYFVLEILIAWDSTVLHIITLQAWLRVVKVTHDGFEYFNTLAS